MARQLDQRQLDELAAFANELFELAGYKTTAEWARESGYGYPNLVNLRNGKRAVDGYNLLRLMRAAAARVDRTATDLGVQTAANQAASLAAIQRHLEQVGEMVVESLENQRTVLRLLTAAPVPRSSTSRPSAKPKGS